MLRSSARGVRSWSALLIVGAGLLGGCAGPTAPEAPPAASPSISAGPTTEPAPSPAQVTPEATAPTEASVPSSGSALAAVASLLVKGRAPMTGYDRELFGQAWADVDRNGCDTRNDVLRRDLVEVALKAGTNECVVASGTFPDPYSGETIAFVKGQDTSSLVQIDHVVALADAWQKGAQGWTAGQREVFANDPLNLLATDGELNSQKGAGDTATWLPPNTAFRCPYVARQVAVKFAYGLWVTQAEKDAMVRVLSACPEEPLSAGSAVTPGSAYAAAEPTVPAAPAPAPAAPGDVTYENCAAARAAGAAPIQVDDPGYSTKLDGDGDGIACEG